MMRFSRLSVRSSLLLVVLVAIAPALAIILHGGATLRRHLEEDASNASLRSAVSVAEVQERLTVGARQILATLAALPAVRRMDSDACKALFARLLKENPHYVNILALDSAGDIVASAKPLTPVNLSDRLHFRNAMKNRAFAAGEFSLSLTTGESTLPFAHPVLDSGGRPVGVLIAGLRLGDYGDMTRQLKLPANSVMAMLDRQGHRMAQYPPLEGGMLGQPFDQALLNSFGADADEGIARQSGPDGITRFYAFKRLRLEPGTPPYMTVVMGIPVEQALARAKSATERNLLLLGAAALLALVLAWTLGGLVIGRRLERLAGTAGRIGRGELDARTGLPHLPNDIGRLARALDAMADLIQKRQEERDSAARAHQDSEQRYRNLFEQSQDAISFMEGEPLTFSLVNPAFCKISGYSAQEMYALKSTDIWRIIHPDDRELVLGKLAERSAGMLGEARYSFRFRRKDGEIRWLDVSGRSVLREHSPLVISIYRDITETRRSQEELARQKNLLHSVIEGTSDAVFVKDPQGRYLLANSETARFVGLPVEEITGKDDTALFPPDQAEAIMANDRLVMHSGVTRQYEETLSTAGGARTFLCTKGPLYDEEGLLSGMFGISRDVTERVKVLELMVQTEKMMSVGGLAAGMAHEINNPLSGILQNAQLLIRRLSGNLRANAQAAAKAGCELDCIRRYMESRGVLGSLNDIQEAGRRAARIVASMLEFSRGSDTAKHPTDLNLLLDKTIELCATDYDLKKKYDFRNIRILRFFDPELPPVPCSGTQIQQVFMNLLTNAAHALSGTPSPVITLRTAREDGFVRVELEDNGPGIPEDLRKRIFEPFFTTKPVGEGTGLGLSVSFFIVVNNHQGVIEALPAQDAGARFVIRLPLAPVQS